MSETNKETTTTRTKRDNYKQTGNNNGSNSDSKDCCLNYFILKRGEVLTSNIISLFDILLNDKPFLSNLFLRSSVILSLSNIISI